MGKSCLLKTHVRNSQGDMVESRLFNDLLNYLPSRALAIEYYAVGTNQEFLNEVRNKAKFDENGEITFNSLRQLANINIAEEEIIDRLNKEIGAGTMNYQEAIVKVKEFNANSQFKDNFLATITYNNKGQYELYVTKKDAVKLAELQKTIEKQEFRDTLVSKLKSYGVGTVFTEGNGGGRYSTINVEQAADGLYNLIQVSHGEHVNSDLAEEAGHFAVAALGQSPLVERLMNLLDDKVIREVLGEEYGVKDLGTNPRREVAGDLVGRALERQLNAKTPWQKLANRVADMAKSIFSKLSGNEIRIAKEQAQKIARNIANGFLSDNFEGNIANALNYKEVLNSAALPYNIKVFKQSIEALGSMAKELEAISRDKLTESITGYLGAAVAGRDTVLNSPTANAELISFEGMCQVLVDIADLLGPDKEIDSLLNSVDFNNTTDFYENMAEHGRNLLKVRTFVKNAVFIASIFREAVDSHDNRLVLPSGQTLHNAYFTDVLNRLQNVDFKSTLDYLEKTLKVVDSKLSSKEAAYFCRFCEDTYGSKYINTAAQVVWKNHKLTLQEADRIPIKDLIEHLDSDIDIFHRYLGSMSNNPDIIGQIADRATKAANKIADDDTIRIQDELRMLESEMMKKYKFKRGHTEMLFEKYKDGSYTGNLITAPDPEILENGKAVSVNWGEWEKAREDFKKKCWEDFKKINPNWESWSGFTRGYQWDKFFRPLMKDWNKNNSTNVPIKDDSGRIIRVEWHPNIKYKSTQFDELCKKYPGINDYLGRIRELKDGLDRKISIGATISCRAPQFKGTFTNKLQNKRMLYSLPGALRRTLRDELLETFCESSEDTDYGDLSTMNNPYDELMGTPMDYEKEKPNRLPLFGINKLEDMTQLSTDIFHSLLSYASMANSYSALNSIVSALEVGKNALNNRDIKGAKREKNLDNHTRAYTRYLKFMDKQVYGISATHFGRQIFGRKVLWNKIVQFATRMGSFLYLGGNVLGGAVNTGTGSIEIFKEAVASEYFNLSDWKAAHSYYLRCLPSNFSHPASLQKDDKMSLFIRYFNVRGDNREKFRSRYGRRSWLNRAIDASKYLPYSSGDHYMQSMAYLAIGHNTNIISANGGKKYNLLEAYRRVGIKSGKTAKEKRNTKDKTEEKYTLGFKGHLFTSSTGSLGISYDILSKNEIFLKDGKDIGKYDMLKALLGTVESAINSPLSVGILLSTEESDYLNSHNLALGDLHKVKTQIQNDIYQMIWTRDDEIKFMDKAREVNNRLHGIYNNQDKTAWHQNWFFNAMLAMKGYALGMIERRFSNAHHSIVLDDDVEGSINTMNKMWCSLFAKDINTQFKDVFCATFFAPFLSKSVKQRLKDAGFSDNQIANTKRNWMDYAIIIALYMLRFLCAEPPKEEREEDYEPDVVEGLCYYLTSRWVREQEAFNVPWGFATESVSLTDIVPIGGHALWEVGTILGYEFPLSVVAEETDRDIFYQRDHPNGKYYQGDPKWINHIIRLTPYWKSIYNLQNPYEAIESYEFGRKLRK